MRVFARRERPHPGAQLSLLEAGDGWRYSLWATNLPAATKGWPGGRARTGARWPMGTNDSEWWGAKWGAILHEHQATLSPL